MAFDYTEIIQGLSPEEQVLFPEWLNLNAIRKRLADLPEAWIPLGEAARIACESTKPVKPLEYGRGYKSLNFKERFDR